MELIAHEALAERMEMRGMTVRPLARLVGRSVGTIGRLRSGRQKTCSPEVAEAIVKALGVPLKSLFVDDAVTTVPCPCAVRCTGHKVAA